MFRLAWKMLSGDRGKYSGLIFGIAFTSFLITFAASFFCGFLTRGFALIAENPGVDVWVMDPAVTSAEQTTNMPDGVLARVRSVAGVRDAAPLALATVEARLPNGRFQPFQLIGVDGATLVGAPARADPEVALSLRTPDAALIDAGGTTDKLQTPAHTADQWPHGPPHLDVPMRELAAGDVFLVNDHRMVVTGYALALPRFPPRPLLYTTLANAARVLPPERHLLTFVLATAAAGVSPRTLASRIEASTGARARTAAEFREDTVRWYLVNSEDVGDVGAMLSLAITVGFGVTAVLLYIFTTENLRHYATLKALGARPRLLVTMVFSQAALCAVIGTGLGLGACSLAAPFVTAVGFPFRMMWFTPLLGATTVLVVSVAAAAISMRPVLKLKPATALLGR
jgi:putative ABC transport system permease protein